jgi:hypothetical protein
LIRDLEASDVRSYRETLLMKIDPLPLWASACSALTPRFVLAADSRALLHRIAHAEATTRHSKVQGLAGHASRAAPGASGYYGPEMK